MGREIKRVPVDFDWPLDKVWQGYLMPEDLSLPTCQQCDGTGTIAAAKCGRGHCPVCAGRGHTGTAAQEAAQEAWESTGPPEGEGWQLWETVTEGSPMSPVFPTAEGLAEWMTRNKCTVSGPISSYDAALRFVRKGWAPSWASSPARGVIDGTEWIGAGTP